MHLGRSSAYENATQSPYSPSDPAQRRASQRNTSYGSSGNIDAPVNKYISPGPSIQASYGNIADDQTQQIATDDTGEELDPLVLGSFDYHNFLSGGSRQTALTTSSTSTPTIPVTPIPTHSSNINVDAFEHSKSQSSIQSTSTSAYGIQAPDSASPPECQRYLLVWLTSSTSFITSYRLIRLLY